MNTQQIFELNLDIEDFGIAFGKSLNFSFEEHTIMAQLMKKILGYTNSKLVDHYYPLQPKLLILMFLFIGKDECPKWKRALEAFKRASAVYKAKHNKSPVIVYDNINFQIS